jgi:putative transposase
MTKCIYEALGKNKESIPADIITDIFSKAYQNINSYFALKRDSFKVSFPKYLNKNDKFVVPFFKNSVKKIQIRNNHYLRLTVGKYISKNYNEMVDDNYICINSTQKTYHKKYIEKSKLKLIEGKVTKKDNFIIDDKYYVEKKNKHIINTYYVFIKIPFKIANKKINLVEIVPRFDDGYKYKCNITYEKYDKTLFKDFSKINKDKYGKDLVSADLGIVNLFTIYDPCGETIIIKGSGLTYINNYFNKRIDNLKSNININKHVKNSIRDLFIKRENKINNEMNKIVWYISNRFQNKKEMIIGYNPSWKDKVQLGKSTNRKFYEIPYREILNKLELALKVKNVKLTITEESYTSKCDALSLEPIKKHNKYMGKRVMRGLFSSKQCLLVNADVNGALNILRKVYPWIKKFNMKLLNPIRIKLTSEGLPNWYGQKGCPLQKQK